MLVDTHCHLNMMVKKEFDIPLKPEEIILTDTIVKEALDHDVSLIINVGTRKIENHNCIILAQRFSHVFATVGIHPNDSDTWQDDIKIMKNWLSHKEKNKIVGIGECGIDKHYPQYNLQQQSDAFKAQIEIALEHDLALVIHSRDAYDETLRILEEYRKNISRAVMHCFSYDFTFAETVTSWNFMLGIGGTVTYPKNNDLREIVINTNLKHIVLETDAPFLPPQSMRGKQNHPQYIKNIAEFIAQIRNEPFEIIANETTQNALQLFNLSQIISKT